MATVGTGKYTYQLVEGWGKLPKGWTLGQTAIATDSHDRVYLFNRSEHPMIVLDPEGRFLTSWGEGVLTDAHGIYIDADDNLYLPVKDAHVVMKYNPEGRPLMMLGTKDHPSDTGWNGDLRALPACAAGPFNKPTDVAVSPAGELYISDGYGNARIHKFTADGRLLLSWGAPGKDPGYFHLPHGLWVHKDGSVFVADRRNHRVQIFAPDGAFLSQWGGLASPCDIFIDADHAVYVAELDAFVSIFTVEGKRVAHWSGPAGAGAHAIWVDSHGDIYVNQNLSGQTLLKYRRCT